MRINELLSETQHTDEGVGKFLGKAAGAVGGAVGGVQGAWQGMKDIYGQKRDRVANVAQRNVQRAGGYKQPAPVGVTTQTNKPAANTTNRPYVAAPSVPTPPVAGTPPTGRVEPTMEPASTNTAPTATNTAPTSARVPAGFAKKEVDQAVNLVSKVRSRDRQNVIKYAADKITALQTLPAAESRIFRSNFLNMDI